MKGPPKVLHSIHYFHQPPSLPRHKKRRKVTTESHADAQLLLFHTEDKMSKKFSSPSAGWKIAVLLRP